jgi:hypothetical protein
MKKYKPSKKQMQAAHDAWLRKRGVHPDQLAKAKKQSASFPNYKSDIITPPTSDKVGNGFVKGNKRYTGEGVHIGQAYNKGNLVVLSTKEAADESTGKRR